MICKIFGLSANALIVNDKYFLLNWDSLTQPIQKELSKNQQAFCEFFTAFLKYRSNFENFEKKDDPNSLCISENTGYEGPG